MKRNAFTLVELMMGVMILAITSTVIIVNINAVKGQSAKREADRLAQWLITRMSIADSRMEGFTLSIPSDVPAAEWASSTPLSPNKDNFEASKGCTFQINRNLTYSVEKNNFTQGGTITVIGKEGSSAPYYVVIAAIGGRVRVSDIKP